MKYEERNDRAILVVEPDDDRMLVLSWLGQWQDKQARPIIVVVPQDAVFRRPGDLRELQQVFAGQRVQGDMLILIMEGNERLRLWARRQGFSVYATLESCLKSSWSGLSQGAIQAGAETESELRGAVERQPQQPFYGHGARPTYQDRESDTPGETYRSSIALAASRTTSGTQQPERSDDQRIKSAFWYASSAHTTEPLVDLSSYSTAIASIPFHPAIQVSSGSVTAATAMVAEPIQMWSDWSEPEVRAESVTAQAPFPTATTFTINVPTASPVWGEEVRVLPSAQVQAAQLAALHPPQTAAAPLVGRSQQRMLSQSGAQVSTQSAQMAPGWGIALLHLRHVYQDRLLLTLGALVTTGILGGLGCGYLLTVVPIR